MRQLLLGIGWGIAGLLLHLGCGSDNSGYYGSPENTGQYCSSVNNCYLNVVDKAQIRGAVTCLSVPGGGYCTHTCTTDADCCFAQNECRSGFSQVCSPFTSTGQNYCFLSCDAATVAAIGAPSDSAFCQQYASPAFTCRSTGGGAANEKVCAP